MYGVWGEGAWTEYMTKLGAQQPRYATYLQAQDTITYTTRRKVCGQVKNLLDWVRTSGLTRRGHQVFYAADAPNTLYIFRPARKRCCLTRNGRASEKSSVRTTGSRPVRFRGRF